MNININLMLIFLKHLHAPFDFKLKTFFISKKSNNADRIRNTNRFLSQDLIVFRMFIRLLVVEL